MPVSEHTILWSGKPGLPGYTKLRFFAAGFDQGTIDACQARVKTFGTAIGPVVPSGVSLSYQTEVKTYGDTGTLGGIWTAGPQSPTSGTAGGSYPGPTGAVIRWNTGLFARNRRVFGRTFLVPCAGIYDTDGSVLATSITIMQNAANALVNGSPPLCLFYNVAAKGQAPAYAVGPIAAATVPDKVVVLRSRRD